MSEIEVFNLNNSPKPIPLGLLASLKPAAVKLILDCNAITISEIIKLTLLDLSFRKVIKIKEDFKSLHPSNSERAYTIVETGTEFKNYKPDNFETYFLADLKTDTYFHLKVYLKKVFETLPATYDFYRQIIIDTQTKNYFNQGILFKAFQLIKLNIKGRLAQQKISNNIDNLNHIIANIIKEEPDEAFKLLRVLKGNIFLLNSLNFEIFDRLDLEIPSDKLFNSEFDLVLDFLYLSDKKYVISDLYDLFSSKKI